MCLPQFGSQNYTTLELEKMSKITQSNPIFLEIEKLRPREVLDVLLKATQLTAAEPEHSSIWVSHVSFQEKFKMTRGQCV